MCVLGQQPRRASWRRWVYCRELGVCRFVGSCARAVRSTQCGHTFHTVCTAARTPSHQGCPSVAMLLMLTAATAAAATVTAPPAWTFPAGERQLFLTEFGIASTTNLARTMHRPAKKGCVIRPAVNATTLQMSGAPQVRSSPMWIEEERRFRFMVMGADGNNPEPARWYTSPDGVQWTFETLANSSSVPGLSLYNIVYDVSESDRSARYKSNLPPSPVFPAGGMAVSGDGIQWRMVPVGQFISTSDEHSLSLDPKSHRFIYTVKRFGKHGRAVALATTTNFWDKNWTDLGIVFETDDLDQVIGREEIEKRLADTTRTQPMCAYSAAERNTSANILACNRLNTTQPPWTEPWSQFGCSGSCYNATCPSIPHCMKTTPSPCYFGPRPCYNVDICKFHPILPTPRNLRLTCMAAFCPRY